MGIGIDEDTASSMAAASRIPMFPRKPWNRTMALFNVKIHILKSGQTFELKTCMPSVADAAAEDTRQNIEDGDESEV